MHVRTHGWTHTNIHMHTRTRTHRNTHTQTQHAHTSTSECNCWCSLVTTVNSFPSQPVTNYTMIHSIMTLTVYTTLPSYNAQQGHLSWEEAHHNLYISLQQCPPASVVYIATWWGHGHSVCRLLTMYLAISSFIAFSKLSISCSIEDHNYIQSNPIIQNNLTQIIYKHPNITLSKPVSHKTL